VVDLTDKNFVAHRQQNMDLFSTLLPTHLHTPSMDTGFLSKAEFLDLLRSIEFEGVFYSSQTASDSADDTPTFFKTIFDELVKTLIKKTPNGTSPKTLLSNSSPSYLTPNLSPEGKITEPQIELVSPQDNPASVSLDLPGSGELSTKSTIISASNTPDSFWSSISPELTVKLEAGMIERKDKIYTDPWVFRLTAF
jgi:hypothetical protein